ncbi:MAG: hypothetical protein HOM16_00485, partial [Woeseia sp.]|nr:hypothetical protein [Woeseia sp.]
GMTALHWAADRGDTALAEMLIFAGANLEAGTRIGHYTALHIATRRGRLGVANALISAGADVMASTTNSGVLPIHLAAASGNADLTALLLRAGADVDAIEGAWGQTPLVFASAANRIEVMSVLLDAGADPSITSKSVDTGKMEKADKAAENRLEQFLAEFKAKEGGGPNWQPQPSQVQAAVEASREIQRKWPDVPNPTCDDDDPENEAAEEEDSNNKCINVVTYNADGEPIDGYPVENNSAEPKPPTYGELVGSWGGLAPLHHAIRQGHTDAVLTLIEGGADVNQPTAGDHTSPLLLAAINGQFDLVPLLVELGADPNLTSAAGTTPLFAAIERQWAPRASYAHPTEHHQQDATHLDVMRVLLEAGADPNVRLKTRLWYMEYTFSPVAQSGVHYAGATPFWRAANALDMDAMAMLKEYGADTGIPSLKLPERKRRRPDPDEEDAKNAEAKKGVTVVDTDRSEPAPVLPEKDESENKDKSGIPPVPVGGPFIYPIHVAAGAGYGQNFAGNAHRFVPDNWLATMRYLVEECDADVNLRDANGYTALHHAASRGDDELVRYLVDKGADVMVVSRKGETTVDMANGPIQRVKPFPTTIALLENFGAVNNYNCVSC